MFLNFYIIKIIWIIWNYYIIYKREKYLDSQKPDLEIFVFGFTFLFFFYFLLNDLINKKDKNVVVVESEKI